MSVKKAGPTRKSCSREWEVQRMCSIMSPRGCQEGHRQQSSCPISVSFQISQKWVTNCRGVRMSRGAACFVVVFVSVFVPSNLSFICLLSLGERQGGRDDFYGLPLPATGRTAGDVWRLGEVGWAVCPLAPCQLWSGYPPWALTLSSGHCSLCLYSPVPGSRRLSAVERYCVHTSPPAGNNFPINLSSSFPIWMCHLFHTNIIIDEGCA